MFIMKWSKEGKTGNRKIDKSYDKNLTRKSSKFIFFMVVAYYLVIYICVIADIWIKEFYVSIWNNFRIIWYVIYMEFLITSNC